MTTVPAGMALKYLPHGKLAHVVHGARPMCQLGYREEEYWRGTGTYGEREHVESLPICPRCERLLEVYRTASK